MGDDSVEAEAPGVDSLPVVAWPCCEGAAAHGCCPTMALETCEGRVSPRLSRRGESPHESRPPHARESEGAPGGPSSERAKRRVDDCSTNVLVIEKVI